MNNAGMSPKGYVNDLGEVMRKFGDKMCVAGNLNPYNRTAPEGYFPAAYSFLQTDNDCVGVMN